MKQAQYCWIMKNYFKIINLELENKYYLCFVIQCSYCFEASLSCDILRSKLTFCFFCFKFFLLCFSSTKNWILNYIFKLNLSWKTGKSYKGTFLKQPNFYIKNTNLHVCNLGLCNLCWKTVLTNKLFSQMTSTLIKSRKDMKLYFSIKSTLVGYLTLC